MFYLASQSPRRIQLFTELGLPFEVVTSDFEESKTITNPWDLVRHNATGKAMNTSASEGMVLGIDTIVELQGKIFEKPKDADEAFEMIRALSGQEHSVLTATCFFHASTRESEIHMSETKVEFYALSDEEIQAYVDTREWVDKSGSYSIQGKSRTFVKRVEGDYYSVMGVPIDVMRKMKELTASM